MKRNRIIINLDKLPRSKKRGGNGFLRVFIVLVVVLLLLVGGVAAGGYFWWRSYQNSPAYTLAILADASQRNDTATIDKLFDIDKVCDDLAGQVRRDAGGSAGAALNSVLPAQTDSALQTLTPKLKETMHDELVKELQRLTQPAKGKPFILVALAIRAYVDSKEENNVATVKVDAKDEHLQITMQPMAAPGPARWQITAVQDDKLTKMVADGMTKALSSSGAQVKEEVNKQWDKLKKPKK